MDNKEIYKKIEKLLYENGIIANAEDMGETIEMDSINVCFTYCIYRRNL